MEIEVRQADRDAANLAFNVWDNTNELALAFARHRHAAIKERDAQIVAWLLGVYDTGSVDGLICRSDGAEDLLRMLKEV